MITRDQLYEHIDNLFTECAELIKKKSADYASDEDPLVNFHYSAEVAGIQSTQTVLTLIAMKVSRLKELLNNKKDPENESIRDSVKDCINYLALLDSLLKFG